MVSSVPPLSKLTRIDARAVWRHEALDFTPWVRANIDSLSEALGLELELRRRKCLWAIFHVMSLPRKSARDIG